MLRAKILAAPMLSIALAAATLTGAAAIVTPTAALADHDRGNHYGWDKKWKHKRHYDRDDRRDSYREGYRDGVREARRDDGRRYYDGRGYYYGGNDQHFRSSDGNSDAATVLRLIQQFSN